VAAFAVYLLNAFFGDRFERKYLVLTIGTILWLWSMYVYIPVNFPTRMRSLGTGWTDGVGHLGAWGGVLIAGQIFTAAAPLGWIVVITIRARSSPASWSGSSGSAGAAARSRSWRVRRWAAGWPPAYPEVSPAAWRCLRRPGPTSWIHPPGRARSGRPLCWARSAAPGPITSVWSLDLGEVLEALVVGIGGMSEMGRF
jgi:hypothetical protein